MSQCAWFGLHPILILLVAISAPANASAIFFDDFESYGDQAAFAATWSATGSPPHMLDTTFGRNSNQSVRLGPQSFDSGTTNRWYRNLTTPILPTDANPIQFSFDFYLDPSGERARWSGDWQSADVRGYTGGTFGAGGLTGVVAIGVARVSDADAGGYNFAYFQGRIIAPGSPGLGYYTLDALPTAVPRSTGWHTLAARMGATYTTFFVDGLPAETVNVGLNGALTSVVLGSDLRSRAFWLDNIQLRQIPEPSAATIAAIALIMAMLFRRKA